MRGCLSDPWPARTAKILCGDYAEEQGADPML